jgi:DNA-binding NarL/FixJ family response regulator
LSRVGKERAHGKAKNSCPVSGRLRNRTTVCAEFLEGLPDIEIAGEASSGKVAVELTKLLVPDVVLMDINMPEMDGIEATQAIHKALPRVAVVGLSMADDADCRNAMRRAGAAAFVSKIERSDVLIAAIRNCGKPGHHEVDPAH